MSHHVYKPETILWMTKTQSQNLIQHFLSTLFICDLVSTGRRAKQTNTILQSRWLSSPLFDHCLNIPARRRRRARRETRRVASLVACIFAFALVCSALHEIYKLSYLKTT